MTSLFENYICKIARQIVILTPAIDFEDLCQAGRMAHLLVQDKPTPYILISIKNAIYKHARKFKPLQYWDVESLIWSPNNLAVSIHEIVRSDFEFDIMNGHYIEGIPVKQLTKRYSCSKSTIYRILNKYKKDLLNV